MRHLHYRTQTDRRGGQMGSLRRYGYIMLGVLRFYKQSGRIRTSNWLRTVRRLKTLLGILASMCQKTKGIPRMSALLAQRLTFHSWQEQYNTDIVNRNKKLLQRCANTLIWEQHSVPRIVQYLMNFGDRKMSHFFVPIYTNAIAGALWKITPIFVIKSGCTITNFNCEHHNLI